MMHMESLSSLLISALWWSQSASSSTAQVIAAMTLLAQGSFCLAAPWRGKTSRRASFTPKRESWIEIKSLNNLQEQPKNMNQYDFIFSEYSVYFWIRLVHDLQVFLILGDMLAGLMRLPVVLRRHPLAMPRELHSQSSTPCGSRFKRGSKKHRKHPKSASD